jgi:hypothetical protein
LQKGDTGEYVKELQQDLAKLGYWISSPSKGYGMQADGIFGQMTESAVLLFQWEHLLLRTGKVDSVTGKAIKARLLDPHFIRPGHTIRPTYTSFQLPPSKNYTHYDPQYEEIPVTAPKDGEKDKVTIMIDNWGTQEMIEMICEVGEDWASRGYEEFWVGDIAKYNGDALGISSGSHHEGGTEVDIDSNIYCSIDESSFNKEDALEFAQTLIQFGAKAILCNCKYVIQHCRASESSQVVYPYGGHSDHFHVHVTTHTYSPHRQEICNDCQKTNTSCPCRGRKCKDCPEHPASNILYADYIRM